MVPAERWNSRDRLTHTKFKVFTLLEMMSQGDHVGCQLEPKVHPASQNDIPGPHVENHLTKVAF